MSTDLVGEEMGNESILINFAAKMREENGTPIGPEGCRNVRTNKRETLRRTNRRKLHPGTCLPSPLQVVETPWEFHLWVGGAAKRTQRSRGDLLSQESGPVEERLANRKGFRVDEVEQIRNGERTLPAGPGVPCTSSTDRSRGPMEGTFSSAEAAERRPQSIIALVQMSSKTFRAAPMPS